MDCHWYLLLLGFTAWHINGLDIPEGCKVQDSLVIDPLEYDSVRFHAYANDTSTTFKATMTCEQNYNFHVIKMTSNHSAVLEIKDQRTEFQAANLKPGWNTFDLKIVDQYSLTDNQHQSWITEGFQVNCTVTKVSIRDGLLMRQCPDGTPTWIVSGSQSKHVPLPAGMAKEKAKKLKMFSMKEFLPSFKVGKKDFSVGWKAGLMNIVEDDYGLDPLPPFREHTLSLQVTEGADDNPKIRITDGTETLLFVTLMENPDWIHFRGRHGDKFALFEKIEQQQMCFVKPSSGEGVSEDYQKVKVDDVPSDLPTTLMLTVLVVILLFVAGGLALREFQHFRRAKKEKLLRRSSPVTNSLLDNNMNNRKTTTLPNLSHQRESHESLYLQPIPAKLFSLIPAVPELPDTPYDDEAKSESHNSKHLNQRPGKVPSWIPSVPEGPELPGIPCQGAEGNSEPLYEELDTLESLP